MKDIRINIAFWDHWKTLTLKAELGLEAVESLQRLWCFAAMNKPSGLLDGMSPKVIEMASRWTGEKGAWIAMLEELRFVEKVGDWYALHDWEDHNGFVATAEARSVQAKAAVNKRWNKRNTPSDTDRNTDGNTDGNTDRNTDGNTPSPYPYPSPYPSPSPKPAQQASSEVQARDPEPAAVAAVRFDPAGFLVEQGADQQTAADYLALRKGKKAASTVTALNAVVTEAAKAGLTTQAVLELCCSRGWAGFKAEWAAQQARAGPPTPAKFDPVAYVNRNRTIPIEASNIIDITAERLA